MDKLKKKNLFIEITNERFLFVLGEYDDELNFKIVDREIFSPSGVKNGKIINLETCVNNIKKTVNKIENRSNSFFSEVNVIINQTDFDCINVSGFKNLNGNQILSEDISYILNDIKSKLVETEKHKKIIHLFNTKYLLDNKLVKNLPIGLHGDFYSHQLTFFMINENEIKNLNSLFNKCNLVVKKIILKNFINGVKLINEKKRDTFINIQINENDIYLSYFYESAFSFFQRFNFGSNIILKDIAKVCSLDISDVQNIVSDTNFDSVGENMYVDKKYFNDKNFRKISLKHIIDISSARIEEVVKIVFNNNKNLINIKDHEISLYLDFSDSRIPNKFGSVFKKKFKNCNLIFNSSFDKDPFSSIKIFGELMSKGWAKEAIPVINKKKSWISSIFSGFFE